MPKTQVTRPGGGGRKEEDARRSSISNSWSMSPSWSLSRLLREVSSLALLASMATGVSLTTSLLAALAARSFEAFDGPLFSFFGAIVCGVNNPTAQLQISLNKTQVYKDFFKTQNVFLDLSCTDLQEKTCSMPPCMDIWRMKIIMIRAFEGAT